MANLSVHLQDSTVGEIGGIAKAVERAALIPVISKMDVAVAYASAAGVDILEQSLAEKPDWRGWKKRFLISIDFGTTEPAALEKIARLPNAELRIPRGIETLQRRNLIPRVPFHSKVWAFYSGKGTGNLGLVIGSGNLTRSGMMTGGEVAVALVIPDPSASAWPAGWQRTIEWFETSWADADPVEKVIGPYAALVRRTAGIGSPAEDATDAARERPIRKIPSDIETQLRDADGLYVRVDRATRNRGPERAGNQIDLPLGTSRFFHLPPQPQVGVIGTIALRVAGYAAILRNVRVGNNSMDKVNLPVPDSVGIESYDDTYLIFKRTKRRHDGAALFELVITDERGKDAAIASASETVPFQMAGGRQYGLLFD